MFLTEDYLCQFTAQIQWVFSKSRTFFHQIKFQLKYNLYSECLPLSYWLWSVVSILTEELDKHTKLFWFLGCKNQSEADTLSSRWAKQTACWQISSQQHADGVWCIPEKMFSANLQTQKYAYTLKAQRTNRGHAQTCSDPSHVSAL